MPTAAERYNFVEVETDGRKSLQETLKWCKVGDLAGVNREIVMKAGNKDVLAEHFVRALQLIERQHNMVINQRVHVRSYESDIIKLQERVITLQEQTMKLQERIISAKTDGEKLKTDIVETVQKEVKSVSKSFSDALQSGTVTNSSPVISQDTIKSVAKQIAVEEELGRNIMVFGLPEEEDEELFTKISEVFGKLNEKPRIEASRLGRKCKNKTVIRPVKVTLSSATAVQQILQKSRNLRNMDKFKDVFLSPDRTAEQRAQQKLLVQELKEKTLAMPGKKYFIREGKVCCADR